MFTPMLISFFSRCPVLFLAGKQSSWLGGHRALIEALKKLQANNSMNLNTIEFVEYEASVNPLIEHVRFPSGLLQSSELDC